VPDIVIPLADQVPVTPEGRPVNVAPVAPMVLYVMAVSDELTHKDCVVEAAPDVRVIALSGLTVSNPTTDVVPQPPVSVTVKGNEPETVGVPLMVTTLPDQDPVTPAGRPEIVAPVAVLVA
jgi:hypothetical protein